MPILPESAGDVKLDYREYNKVVRSNQTKSY